MSAFISVDDWLDESERLLPCGIGVTLQGPHLCEVGVDVLVPVARRRSILALVAEQLNHTTLELACGVCETVGGDLVGDRHDGSPEVEGAVCKGERGDLLVETCARGVAVLVAVLFAHET
jgi:hypothetical protein